MSRDPLEREVGVPVFYKARRVDHGFRADFLIDGQLLLELKCVPALHPTHRAQVITYLTLLGLNRGLLLNFHGRRLVDGLVSIVG
jgi:GxxExxY protein